jgi:hypothetical protein
MWPRRWGNKFICISHANFIENLKELSLLAPMRAIAATIFFTKLLSSALA